MLITLFKHEMRATAKTFMWFYIAFAVIALINAVLNPLAMGTATAVSANMTVQPMWLPGAFVPEAIRGVFMALYGVAVAVVMVLTIVIIILRFYRNLLGDEGYLMMTLPVTREQHILAKLIAAVIWSICTGVLVFLSSLLLLANAGALTEITAGINEIIANGTPVDRWIAQFVVLLLVSTITSILMLYAAMGIGPNLLKNRVGGSILAYIIIYIASQIVMFGVVVGTVTGISGGPRMVQVAAVGTDTEGVTVASNVPAIPMPEGGAVPQEFISAIGAFVGSTIICTAAIGVVCWLITVFMLKRKLNLA